MDAEGYLSDLRDELNWARAAGEDSGDRVARAWGAALALAAAGVIERRSAHAWGATFMGHGPRPGASAPAASPPRGARDPPPLPAEPPWRPARSLVPMPSHQAPRVTLVELHDQQAAQAATLRLFAAPDPGQSQPPGHDRVVLRGIDDAGSTTAVERASSTGDICWASCRFAATCRTLTLSPPQGGGSQVLPLEQAIEPEQLAGRIDYRSDQPGPPPPTGARAVRQLELLAGAGRLHASIVEGGIGALQAFDLIDASEATSARQRLAARASSERVKLMGTPRRITYLGQPPFAGVHVHSVLEFDDAVSIRWRQLPLPTAQTDPIHGSRSLDRRQRSTGD